MRRTYWFLLWAGWLTVTAAEPVVSLYFAERPPYQHRQADGQVLGLTAEPAERAFKRAQIPFQWKILSAKRELQMVRDNLEPGCLVGWYKNPEREKFALFSRPIYQEKPPHLIFRTNFAGADSANFIELLTRHKPRLLVKDGYSYGGYLDQLFVEHKALLVITSEEQLAMVQQIHRGRADIMLFSGDEVGFHAALLARLDLRARSYPDLPPGEQRYLMCSRQVGPQRMARIDAAL